MVRILHVLGHVPIGGVGTFLINSLKFVDSKKVKFDFVMFNSNYKSNFQKEIISLGGNVEVFNSYLRASNVITMINELNHYLTKHDKYDIVHLHAPNLGAIVFPLTVKHGIKVRILHSHAIKYSDTLIKSLRNFVIELPNKIFATHHIACSKEAGEFLFGSKEFFIARNGIEVNKFKFNPEMRNKVRNYYKVQDKIIVGHIGNFLPTKNHEFLIDVFGSLYSKNKEFVLYLVGEGPLELKIRNKVAENNLSNAVKFLGHCDNINELLQMFDVLVLPSKNEGFGIVAVEAQISGLRSFVSDKFSDDVKVTNYINFLKLDSSSPEEWAKEINNSICYSRSDQSDNVKKLGYDARITAHSLEEFYLNIHRK
jgi:glycosyltransferase involved in cell wall biosynthesis